MWPFTKKISLEQSGLFQGLTDWHSHILPGVDDGFQKMEDSLAALQKYEELGVKSVWPTPHIMEECRNTTQGLRDRFAELQAEYQGPIQLQLAAENMLDSLFEERFQANDLLTIGPGGNYLLVETSYVNPPYGMENMMQQIMSTGLTPILAHPERYRYMEQDDYMTWKERGVVFQTNFMSLVGMYGETARSKPECSRPAPLQGVAPLPRPQAQEPAGPRLPCRDCPQSEDSHSEHIISWHFFMECHFFIIFAKRITAWNNLNMNAA